MAGLLAQTGRHATRSESRMWRMPEIVSSVTPASYGTGDAFNTIKAVGLLPRPGLSGATWDKSAKGPRREIEEHMSQEGGKLQAVHYRISRPCGISGKLLRKYSPDRQPTPITRMHEMDAKRRAAAVAKAKSADILILDRDRPGTRGSLTGASRPGSRASRQATGGGLRAGSKDLPRVHYAEDLGAGDERREEQGLSGTAESLHRLPVKERLHKFSKALTERFPRAVDAFAFIDDDGSGALSVDELAGGLTEVGIAIDVASLKEMMTELGLATRSTIRYKDFLQLFLGTFKPISDEEREAKALAEAQELLIRKLSKNESGAIDENALLAAFQAFDDNGDGWIDQDELRRGFLSFGLGDFDDPNSPMLPFKRLIESCDDNDDGKINYKEFLELAGLTSQHGKNLSVGGGAVSGFREMNKFDAKILERERCRKMLLGLEDIEPDTPKGLTRWRAKYAKSFFGDKYKTNLEKAAKALVDDKAEGRYVEPKLEWNEATRRYMEQVLKVPALKVDSNQTSGVQKFPRSQDQTTWSTSAHDAMSRPYWSGPRSPPPLQRVDATGTNSGILIPGYHPGVTRQTGPFRKPNLLSSEWSSFMDVAVHEAIRLTHDKTSRPGHMRDAPYEATLRGKTVKDVVMDYNKENKIDRHSNSVSLKGPVDVYSPFSRFGGQWTLHDTVQDIIHKGKGDPVGPPHPTGILKPMIQEPAYTDIQLEALRLRGNQPLPTSGKSTTDLDKNEFMSQPMQRDLFCRTVLNSGKRTASPKRSSSEPRNKKW